MCCACGRTCTRPNDEGQNHNGRDNRYGFAGRRTTRARLWLNHLANSRAATRESLSSYWRIEGDYSRASTIPANLCNSAVPPDGINQSGEQEEAPQKQLREDGPLHAAFRVSDCPADCAKFLFRHEDSSPFDGRC